MGPEGRSIGSDGSCVVGRVVEFEERQVVGQKADFVWHEIGGGGVDNVGFACWRNSDGLGPVRFEVVAHRDLAVDLVADDDLSLIHISEPTRPY